MKDNDFIRGFVCAIQMMYLTYGYAGGDFIAPHVIRESGFSLEELLKAQKVSGYRNREMNKLFREALASQNNASTTHE